MGKTAGMLWLHKGLKTKRVHPKDLQLFMDAGWLKGRIMQSRNMHSSHPHNTTPTKSMTKLRRQRLVSDAKRLRDHKTSERAARTSWKPPLRKETVDLDSLAAVTGVVDGWSATTHGSSGGAKENACEQEYVHISLEQGSGDFEDAIHTADDENSEGIADDINYPQFNSHTANGKSDRIDNTRFNSHDANQKNRRIPGDFGQFRSKSRTVNGKSGEEVEDDIDYVRFNSRNADLSNQVISENFRLNSRTTDQKNQRIETDIDDFRFNSRTALGDTDGHGFSAPVRNPRLDHRFSSHSQRNERDIDSLRFRSQHPPIEWERHPEEQEEGQTTGWGKLAGKKWQGIPEADDYNETGFERRERGAGVHDPLPPERRNRVKEQTRVGGRRSEEIGDVETINLYKKAIRNAQRMRGKDRDVRADRKDSVSWGHASPWNTAIGQGKGGKPTSTASRSKRSKKGRKLLSSSIDQNPWRKAELERANGWRNQDDNDHRYSH